MDNVKIMEEEWKCLIILDACRYDYFERVYGKYLKGTLSKKISAGSSTWEWRNNSFPGTYDDTVFVSSNPYINSIMPVKEYLGSEHFYRVYDVWHDGWDHDKGTVLPETVTNVAIDVVGRHRDKRIIIHYLQPHTPYLTLDMESFSFPVPDLGGQKVLMGTKQSAGESMAKVWFVKKLASLLVKTQIVSSSVEWRLREIVGLTPASPMDAVRRKYGDDGLRQAYKANVELVLEEVSRLLYYLSGRIIITSDHGELLGEQGCYGHSFGSTSPYLIEVPWFVVDKDSTHSGQVNLSVQRSSGETPGVESIDHSRGENAKEQIKQRLKALGYFD